MVAIFDHDGTISTIREGWESVMRTMMIESVLGDAIASVSPREYERVGALVDDLIHDSTGVQTLVQMRELRRLVRAQGFVPSEQILDIHEYKAIYNRALMESVTTRTQMFREQRLSTADLTIKDAVAFLQELADWGVRLYLASGTDQEDVRREARLLGYDHYFTGRIYGSVGDIDNDPKRVVLQRIMRELSGTEATGRCVVFGDGPVEMREARKNDCVAVGLVSDEVRRYGRNGAKRERLILAGADYLIPDFSWRKELSHAIGWST